MNSIWPISSMDIPHGKEWSKSKTKDLISIIHSPDVTAGTCKNTNPDRQKETLRKMESSMNKYRDFWSLGIKESSSPLSVWDVQKWVSGSGPQLSPEISIPAITYTHRNAWFICFTNKDLLLDVDCYRQKLWYLKSQHSCPDSFPRKHFFCSLSWNIFPGEIYKPRMTGYSISMWMGNWT